MRQKLKVTMEDVARQAGVSSATVSAVLNGTAIVSADRTKRVRDAIQSLEYHAEQVPRTLKVGRTFVIGVVLPDLSNAFFIDVIRGVEDSARAAGYSAILCNSNNEVAQEERHLNVLSSRRVDGVLLAYANSAGAYDRVWRRRFPLVFFDRVPTGMHRGAVSSDNVASAQALTRHVIELGHRDIAFVTGDMRLAPHVDRLDGFRRAMEESQLLIRDEYVQHGNLSLDTGTRLCRKLLELAVPPTAIISANNRMMLGMLRALRELNVRCPEEVSIAGFDDPLWAEFFSPPLTVVSQHGEELGRRAFAMLLSKIEGNTAETGMRGELVLLDAELKVRQSTGPPRR